MDALYLPPKPKGHLIGDNLPEFAKDPLGFLQGSAQTHGDVVRLRFMGQNFYLLNHPDLIEYVLVENNKNFQKSKILRNNRRLLGDGLLTSEGDFWRRQRRLTQPAFHRRRVAGYGEAMSSYAERTIAGWRSGREVDVHEEMMSLTLEIVAKTLFDADVAEDARDVGEAMEVALQNFTLERRLLRIPKSVPTPRNLRFERAAKRLSWIFWLLARNPGAEGELTGELEGVLGGRAPAVADLAYLFVHRARREGVDAPLPARLEPRAGGEGRLRGRRLPDAGRHDGDDEPVGVAPRPALLRGSGALRPRPLDRGVREGAPPVRLLPVRGRPQAVHRPGLRVDGDAPHPGDDRPEVPPGARARAGRPRAPSFDHAQAQEGDPDGADRTPLSAGQPLRLVEYPVDLDNGATS